MCHCQENDKQDNNKVDLFGMLRRSDGTKFDDDIIRNWYRARHYVLTALEAHDALYNMVGSHQRVHVVLEGTSGLMMAVARQIALLVHFPTFDDSTGKNRTLITILFDKNKVAPSAIIDFVSQEEYLCNLSRYCKCSVRNFGDATALDVRHEDSFLDIELEFVGFDGEGFDRYNSEGAIRIKESYFLLNEPEPLDETIDLSLAKRVNMVYNVGMDFDNLASDDPNTAERYDRALFYFCYHQSPQSTQDAWNKIKDSQTQIRNKLSNVFCADCFLSRLLYVVNRTKRPEGEILSSSAFKEFLKNNYQKVLDIVKDNLQMLARCEHARWNVEKLVLGFRPLTDQERLEDEQLFGSDRQAYRKRLKDNGIHIDLCSYRDLRRIDPGNMKYDCFLMIAAPRILLENEMGKL